MPRRALLVKNETLRKPLVRDGFVPTWNMRLSTHRSWTKKS